MERILIIDDEEQNLKALKLALSDENPTWEIFTASSEAEGKALLEKQFKERAPIAVVLTDLVLANEERGGMNILEAVKRIDPHIIAILFTAKEKSLNRAKAFEYGAFDVVGKNIRGASARDELIFKTRVALRHHYETWKRINSLRRYFDPKVFENIERKPELLELNSRIITIVFWDIRGFSKLCDDLKTRPDLITEFLKEYYEIAAEVIFAHDGVLDKFIGDGVMALFGVFNHRDVEGKEYALSAVHAAINLRTRFNALVKNWMEKWRRGVSLKVHEIGLGCGMNTEKTLSGNVGTDFRDQFTALGSPVNLASRIEPRSEAGQILISQSTYTLIEDSIPAEFFGEISDIKNMPGIYPVYQVK